eukprot:m.762066 g.762066  ORF g.762066 m.762066 type:complete len:136 (+) comp59047_c0_seq7:592-999(+)
MPVKHVHEPRVQAHLCRRFGPVSASVALCLFLLFLRSILSSILPRPRSSFPVLTPKELGVILGRQILQTGKHKSSQALMEAIERVQAEDLSRIARQMLNSPVAYSVFGETTHVLSYENLNHFIKALANVKQLHRY